MSINKYQPHVFVLPEDDANRQMANGFLLNPSLATHRIRVIPEAGGWRKVLDEFETVHIAEMGHNRYRSMVLLIDFDGDENRLRDAKAVIPPDLVDRVFILGAWSKPEALKADLGRYEKIGSDMAKDCRDGTERTWGHRLLQHNAGELDRLRQHVGPILFPGN